MPIDYNPFDTAYATLGNAANNALPSPESLDRSAARLRSRLDTSQRANEQQLEDEYSGRGMLSGGNYEGRKLQSRATNQNAYAQGLSQLYSDWDAKQQEGSKILAGIGASQGGLAADRGKLQIGEDQLAFDRNVHADDMKKSMAQTLTDFYTAMATNGNVLAGISPSSPFASNYNWLKQSLFNFLGLGPGEDSNYPFPNW